MIFLMMRGPGTTFKSGVLVARLLNTLLRKSPVNYFFVAIYFHFE